MSDLHPSRVDVSEDDRGALTELLGISYAATFDLRSQVVQAVARVRGEGAIALSGLCADLDLELADIASGLLSRALTLGGRPATTLRSMAAATMLPEYDVSGTSASDHLEALADRFELVAASLRRNVDTAARMEDSITAHVFAAAGARVESSMAQLERA